MALPQKKKAEDTRPVPGAMLLPRERGAILMEKKLPGNIGSAMAFMLEMTERSWRKIRSDPGTEESTERILFVHQRNIGMQEGGTVMKTPLS